MNTQTLQHMERAYGLDIARGMVTVAMIATAAAARWSTDTAARWRLAMQARRDRAAMLAMSDYMLRDIGMSRHDLMAMDASSQRP